MSRCHSALQPHKPAAEVWSRSFAALSLRIKGNRGFGLRLCLCLCPGSGTSCYKVRVQELFPLLPLPVVDTGTSSCSVSPSCWRLLPDLLVLRSRTSFGAGVWSNNRSTGPLETEYQNTLVSCGLFFLLNQEQRHLLSKPACGAIVPLRDTSTLFISTNVFKMLSISFVRFPAQLNLYREVIWCQAVEQWLSTGGSWGQIWPL